MLSSISAFFLISLMVIYVWFLYKSANNISYLVYKTDFASLKRDLYFYICALSPDNKKSISSEHRRDLVDSFYILIRVWGVKNRAYLYRLKENIHDHNFEGKYDDELVIISCFIKLVDRLLKDSEEEDLLERYSKGFNLMESRVIELTNYIDFITSSVEKKFKKTP